MKRFVVAAVSALALVALTAGVVSASPPRAQLRNFSCRHAVSPISRQISVWALMRPLAGTRRLQERWALLSRTTPGTPFTAVSGTNLDTWVSPTVPTLGQRRGDVWRLHKSVADLAAPAAYRLQATFRWLGAGDRVLGIVQRTTPTCSEPELRPDLQVQSITVEAMPKHPTLNRYVATIVNAGATAAGPFDVLFAPGGGLPVMTRSEIGLRAHRRVQETFVGPVCAPSSAPSVTVDPAGAVNDFNRANNQLTAVCPAAPGM
jgi:hypothetical protein